MHSAKMRPASASSTPRGRGPCRKCRSAGSRVPWPQCSSLVGGWCSFGHGAESYSVSRASRERGEARDIFPRAAVSRRATIDSASPLRRHGRGGSPHAGLREGGIRKWTRRFHQRMRFSVRPQLTLEVRLLVCCDNCRETLDVVAYEAEAPCHGWARRNPSSPRGWRPGDARTVRSGW